MGCLNGIFGTLSLLIIYITDFITFAETAFSAQKKNLYM